MINWIRTFVLLLALAPAVSTAKLTPQPKNDVNEAIKFKVDKYVLDNGMTVVLHEDHTAPIFSFHQWYRVGARHELPGRTGLAHFFEHLMFKGTKKRKGNEFDRMIRSNGGSNNAFTTFDHTGYYMNMPTHALEVAIDLESDRMRNLAFTKAHVKSEREVVKEERRYRYDNRPQGALWEALFKTVFKVHPYKNMVIGSMRDLNAATMQDFRDFYNIYYAPNNSVLVIAGDIDIPQTKKWIQKYYGGIKPQKIPPLNVSQEPVQKSGRKVKIAKQIQSPLFAVAYLGSKNGDDDAYALDLLGNILGNGTSSRLYKRLIHWNQMATSLYASAYSLKDPGIFEVYVELKPGQNLKTTARIVEQEISKVRKTLVSKKELQKAKNQMMKDYVDSLKTVGGRARAIAVNEIHFNDYTEIFRDLPRYNKVTREDLRRVAKKYLTFEKRNLIEIVPEKPKQAKTHSTKKSGV